MKIEYADKIQMQNQLFAELSQMFGQEVPLYAKSLLVNRECNRTVCALLGRLHLGFNLSADQLDRASGERHGAIRIGQASEYRWITRWFEVFGMEPHNYYDMTDLGEKSQPIIATAFRSKLNPDHRIFCSLLLTDYFDAGTKTRIETLLAGREVFSLRAKELVTKAERQAGLEWEDARALIAEGVQRIFKWTGQARDYALYTLLCSTGFKIAADIACFETHHLNHLTPNSFCLDLYTAAMKFCLGEIETAGFGQRAATCLQHLAGFADQDYLKLHFKHLTRTQLAAFRRGVVTAGDISLLVEHLTGSLQQPDLDLSRLKHAGFKDYTEGPPADTPVLLRQDAYKALSEPVRFRNADGTLLAGAHTARFGEIEQRFYAVTPKGRQLYDQCLAAAERARAENAELRKTDFAAFESLAVRAFTVFPKKLPELLEQQLVYGLFSPTEKGLKNKNLIVETDIHALIRQGYVDYAGQRYEDFLPLSAAGIFASNLNQSGTQTSAEMKPVYAQARFEIILGRRIIDANVTYAGLQAESLLEVYAQLGLLEKLAPALKTELEQALSAYLAA
jgi:uncharacterized glyoxalase superfamily metalloenzyme YdcJ